MSEYQLGHGGEIDADTVDGKHLTEIIMEARKWSGGGGLPKYASDPATAGLQPGFAWYNTTEKTAKLWDGSSKRVFVPTGGAGGTYKLSPSYTIYKSGSDYYAMDEDGNIDYGGSGDAGAVDGAYTHLVINAAVDAL